MKITNTITMQMQPAIAASAGVNNQATSSGNVNRARELVDRKDPPVQNQKPSADMSQRVNAEDLKKAIEKLNEQMAHMNRSIQFSIDDQSHDVVVRIVDKSSGEVISQIPPEEVLKLRERMRDMAGVLIEKTV